MTKKTICDVCGVELDEVTQFGGYFEYEGLNPITWARDYDLCEEHGQEVLGFIQSLRKTAKEVE